ncbi:unnamed protein product [Caenorhabditis bovis]|uniref:Uncharacterized protein n=1 Tax=Caenorhabditis bovis TaxID=2654633 RepID=A0A8S1EEU8_9PELO|nr:unnamed protein product [Caenorhabditis bovis]
MSKTFEGKVAIVTGSSNGIGRACAVLFAKKGAKVTITGRNADRLKETADLITTAGVPESHINIVQGDVTNSATLDEIVKTTVDKFGKIDILVNNAGCVLSDENGKMNLEASVDTCRRTMDLNLHSVIELTQKCRPHLIASKGEVVNISSIAAGPHAFKDQAYYAMSKSALDQFTRCAAVELIAHGVRVNSVNPGAVFTGIGEAMGLPKELATKMFEYYNGKTDYIPTGAAGMPNDIATIVAFLADRSSSGYMIGQTLTADGGSSLILSLNTGSMEEVLKELA